jgi:hypothetical protein
VTEDQETEGQIEDYEKEDRKMYYLETKLQRQNTKREKERRIFKRCSRTRERLLRDRGKGVAKEEEGQSPYF